MWSVTVCQPSQESNSVAHTLDIGVCWAALALSLFELFLQSPSWTIIEQDVFLFGEHVVNVGGKRVYLDCIMYMSVLAHLCHI